MSHSATESPFPSSFLSCPIYLNYKSSWGERERETPSSCAASSGAASMGWITAHCQRGMNMVRLGRSIKPRCQCHCSRSAWMGLAACCASEPVTGGFVPGPLPVTASVGEAVGGRQRGYDRPFLMCFHWKSDYKIPAEFTKLPGWASTTALRYNQFLGILWPLLLLRR